MTKKKISCAAEDLKYLLDRKYPKKTALNLVTNHYRLDADDRNFLVRYVFPEREIKKHKNRLVPVDAIRGRDIVVDGYNVLIIAESILYRRRIVEGMDGFIRDQAALFSRYRFSKKTKRTASVILNTLKEHNPKSVLFILDSQMKRSGELAAHIRREMKERSIAGDALTESRADSLIKRLNRITLTSDSAIIEKIDKVVDLGRVLLEKKKR